MASRLPALFATAIVALAGCGGGADENEASAWSGIRDCLVESGIREFDEIPPTGPHMPPEVNADHELAIFFYDSATEAERAKDEAPQLPGCHGGQYEGQPSIRLPCAAEQRGRSRSFL